MDWRKQAVALYERACAEGLEAHRQVRAFVDATTTADRDWGVACSGGVDSLALLLWLYGAAQAEVFRVGEPVESNSATDPRASGCGCAVRFKVLHLDHGLRGADSAGDAAFVAEVASALGWPLYAERLPAAATTGSEQAAANCERAAAEPGQVLHGATAGEALSEPTQTPPFGDSPSEEVLRKARQAFYVRSGCAVIFQGHHLGDVAETMLMRLAAGSGVEGLAAPRPVSRANRGRPVYLRPLLEWKKTQIVALLSGLGIHWREDASNARDDYFRNRVRLSVLPALEQAAAGRDVFAAAALSRARLEEDAQALQVWLDAVWQKACTPGTGLLSATTVRQQDACAPSSPATPVPASIPAPLSSPASASAPLSVPVPPLSPATPVPPASLDWRLFALLPRAIRRRALWRLLVGVGQGVAAALGGAAVEAMLDALETARVELWLSAGRQHFLHYEPTSGRLAVVDAAYIKGRRGGPLADSQQVSLPLAPGQTVCLPEGGSVAAQWVELDQALRQRIRSGEIPCSREVYLALPQASGEGDCTPPLLRVRFWRAGDRYRPLGAPGSRKVQDMFTDKKVPPALRARLPVVTDGQGDAVLWVAGLPPASACAVGIGTKWALWLTYTPPCKTLDAPIII